MILIYNVLFFDVDIPNCNIYRDIIIMKLERANSVYERISI